MHGDTSFNIKNFNIDITINITIIIILIMTTYSHRQYNNRKYNI